MNGLRPFKETSAISIINRDVLECNLPFRGDTYDGCHHNCIYCYARDLKENVYRNWYTDNPRPIDIDKVKKRFLRAFKFKNRQGGVRGPTSYVNRAINHRVPIRLGTQTDCFQPCEKDYGVTYELMEFLVEQDYPFIINTKSPLVADDKYIEVLKEAAERENVVVQVTLTTLNEKLARKIETRAPAPQRRLEGLRKLADNGIPTQVRYSPYIPIISSDEDELLREAADAGVKDIITEFLRITKNMNEHFKKNVGIDLIEGYYKEHGKYSNNYWRVDSGTKFEKYRELKRKAESLGMDLYVCSEEDPSINDCESCCGTDKFRGFQTINTAAANTIYKVLLEKGEVRLSDMEERFWSINWEEFKKKWNSGIVERILINTKIKVGQEGTSVRDDEGNLIYVHRGEED